MTRIRGILIPLLLLGSAGIAAEPENLRRLSGQIGGGVPSYQMRTVSGPTMNRSVCLVCRNGDRPVVMVVLREVGPNQRILLRNLDRLLRRERETGLRGFCAVLSPDPFREISRVQTFAFNGQVEMPVGITPDALGERSGLDIPRESATTVFLYSELVIRRRFDFGADGPTHDEIREVLRAAAELPHQPSFSMAPAEPAAAFSDGR